MQKIRKIVVWTLCQEVGTQHPATSPGEQKLSFLEPFSIAIIGRSVLEEGWSGAHVLVGKLREECRERWPELVNLMADAVGPDEFVEF